MLWLYSVIMSKSKRNLVYKSVWGIHLKKMHKTEGTSMRELSKTEVWKLKFKRHSKRLEYKEIKLSSVDELFLLEGEWLEGDFRGYFLALNESAEGDLDWLAGDWILWFSALICSFLLTTFFISGLMMTISFYSIFFELSYSSSSLMKLTKN